MIKEINRTIERVVRQLRKTPILGGLVVLYLDLGKELVWNMLEIAKAARDFKAGVKKERDVNERHRRPTERL